LRQDNFLPNLKIHPRTCLEGPEGDIRYSSTPSLTLALDGVGDQLHASAALPPGKRPSTHFTERWIVGEEKLAPTGSPTPDRPARSESLYRQRYPVT
jgi:hypothetical protein